MIIYSWISFVFGIIFAILAIFFLVLTISGLAEPRAMCFLIFFCLTLCSFGAIHEAFEKPKPTQDDVMEGNAVYQETQIIQNGDTIRLYDIVWKAE